MLSTLFSLFQCSLLSNAELWFDVIADYTYFLDSSITVVVSKTFSADAENITSSNTSNHNDCFVILLSSLSQSYSSICIITLLSRLYF